MSMRETERLGDLPVDPEAELVHLIARGDRGALAELYSRFQLPLLHYLRQFTSDQGLAEEIFQDTLVAVWQNAGSYAGTARVQAWLFGIARRRAWKTLRARKLSMTDATELDKLPALDPEPEAALLAQVARDEMAAAIERLDPIHREIFLLIFVHELSYKETADVLNVPLGTVKSRLNHAKRALRRALDPGEDEKP